MTSAEIAVVGAGPVGCALALELHRCGRPVVLCAKTPAQGAPFRPIALSHASRLILQHIGAWDALPATPIRTIRASQAGAFGRTHLAATDAGVPALGYVLDYATLAASLYALAISRGIPVRDQATRGIPVRDKAPPASLLVHAEGIAPQASEKSYGQDALVTLVTAQPPASDIAFERFTSTGPLALLPLAGRYAVIWAMQPERASALLAAGEAQFLAALAAASGGRAGCFDSAGERSRVSLALRVRPSRTIEREVFVGNTAQTLHPVAGQGLNLGLRDAWDLARLLQDAEDPGDPRLLARYDATRRLDVMATIRVTDLLASAFTGSNPLLAVARGTAMTALDAFSPARRFFARRMIFGASAVP